MAQKKLSKRYGLTKLADCWREKIFETIVSEKLKIAVAILSSTGCRPSELERGIVVQLKAGQLYIGIHGSKVDEATGRGQPRRLVEIDTTTPWGQYLIAQVSQCEHNGLIAKYDAGSISQRLREKSKQLWPKIRPLISAYTYRHFIAKSMKESSVSTDVIAMTLGHASDYSATAYGRVGKARKCAGLHGVLNANASNPVRHSPKTDKLTQLVRRKSLKQSVKAQG